MQGRRFDAVMERDAVKSRREISEVSLNISNSLPHLIVISLFLSIFRSIIILKNMLVNRQTYF